MNIKFSLYIVGNLLKLLGITMLVPAVCSLIYGGDDLWVFVVSFAITTSLGFALEKTLKTEYGSLDEVGRKEGFLITSVGWIAVPLFGALPFILYGVFSNPIDAIFESVSGFTTTGASVLTDIESLPRGIIFWRSFTQWLGGMGIVVLGIAILPRLAVGGMQLMARERAGPTAEKITPRIAETAKSLWFVYLMVSIAMVLLLYLCGLPLYDSIIHMFSALSTGGYSSKNLSVGAYDNVAAEIVITFFMLVGGINFSLLVSVMKGRFSDLVTNPEFLFYFSVNIAVIVIVTLTLWLSYYPSFSHSLREGAFQVVSLSTGTGYTTANYDAWPPFAKWILFMLLFSGGSVGSTSGGIKHLRIVVLLKRCYQEIYLLVHPKAVLPLRLGKKIVEPNISSSIGIYAIIYIALFLVGALVIMLEGVPIMTAISASATSLGNVGPGFELVGPTSNFAHLSNLAKLDLSFLMLLGRLEIFTILVLFLPSFWKE